MAKAFKQRYTATSKTGNFNTGEEKEERRKISNGLTMSEIEKGQTDYNIVLIPLSEIAFHPNNLYAQVNIPALAKSIRGTNGLINPINIARIEDLSEDSKIKKELIESGIDLTNRKFVIFDGERRYRAYTLLEEEERKSGGNTEKYSSIPANLLTAEQAKNEEKYHNDSNLFARQLTHSEIIINIKYVIDRIKTNEDKRAARVYMNNGSEEGINPDPDIAAKKFRADEYCSFYLKKEIGIDVSPQMCKKVLALLNNAAKEVIDAVIARTFPEKLAFHLNTLPNDKQIKLLNIYLEKGKKDYSEELKKEEFLIRQNKVERKNNKDQVKNFNSLKEDIEKRVDKIIDTSKWLGEKDKEETEKMLKVIKKTIEEIEKTIKKLED